MKSDLRDISIWLVKWQKIVEANGRLALIQLAKIFMFVICIYIYVYIDYHHGLLAYTLMLSSNFDTQLLHAFWSEVAIELEIINFPSVLIESYTLLLITWGMSVLFKSPVLLFASEILFRSFQW